MNELTELERIKLENYALKIAFMQQQLQQIGLERATYIREVEANHPGYVWREQQGLVSEEDIEALA